MFVCVPEKSAERGSAQPALSKLHKSLGRFGKIASGQRGPEGSRQLRGMNRGMAFAGVPEPAPQGTRAGLPGPLRVMARPRIAAGIGVAAVGIAAALEELIDLPGFQGVRSRLVCIGC